MRPYRLAAWAAAGTLGATAVAGVAYSASADSTPVSTTSTAPAPGAHPHAKAHPQAHPRGPVFWMRLLRRVEYGQFTVHTKKGPRVVDVQRGKVTAVSSTAPDSITVASPDHTFTYVVTDKTRVRVDGKKASISDVHSGDRVGVVATTINGQEDAVIIIDRGPAPTKPAA